MSAAEAADKKKLLDRKIRAINKDYGKTIVARADSVVNPYFMRRPTGITALDEDLGGGFPPGVTCISGPDGVGKSFLVYLTMAMHQRIYGEKSAIAHASVEYPLDHFFLRRLNVIVAVPDKMIEERNDWRKKMGLPAFTKADVKELKRQVGSFWDISGGTMENTMNTIIDVLSDPDLRKAENQFGLISVDSVSALEPKANADVDLDEDGKQAAHASCMTRFYAKYFPLMSAMDGDPMYTSLLFTQQVRSNRAKSQAPSYMQKYLPDYVPAGAYAGKHGKFNDILLTPGQRVRKEGEGGGGKETVQKTIKWEITKGKAGTHEGKTGEIDFDFQYERFINTQRTMLVAGMRRGVFMESGGLITYRDPVTGQLSDTIKDIPAESLVERMREDVTLELELRQKIMIASGIECRYL